jgi:PAS domain S-box-containing protein
MPAIIERVVGCFGAIPAQGGSMMKRADADVFRTVAFNVAVTPEFVRTTVRVALAAALLLAAIYPFRTVRIGFLPVVFFIYGATLVAGYVLSGFMLASWSRRAASGPAAVLAATYFCAAVLVIGNVSLMFEPNRVPFAAQGSTWQGMLWHLVLPLGVLLSTWFGHRMRTGLRASAAVAGAACAAAFAFTWFACSHFPLLDHGRIAPPFFVASAVAGAIALLALWRLLANPARTAFDVMLALVVVTVPVDLALLLTSPMGYSVGGYAARAVGLLSGLIVVTVLGRWMLTAVDRIDLVNQHLAVAEAAPTITFLTDASGTDILYMNQCWTEFTGRPTAEALGSGWRASMHPDDLERRRDLDTWFRTEGNQLRLLDRHGNYVWHLARYGQVRDRAGRRIGWVGTATNLDRERRAFEESRRLADQLRSKYEAEREMSAALRNVFSPSVLLPEVDGIRFSAVYRPFGSDERVGGDWYDSFVAPDGTVIFTMGDVSGHGLTAAASMLRVREGIRMAALTEHSPGRALRLMNQMLSMGGDVFASALVAFVDPKRGRMTLAVAGHPAPVLIRGGRANALPVHGMVLGATDFDTFEEHEFGLEAGDEIAFYTDGLIECEKMPIQGQQRLLEALAGLVPERLEPLVEGLLAGGQSDDATIVLLSYRLGTVVSWHFRADTADSAQSARAAFCYHLRRNGVGRDAVARAELVFGELVGNVVRHAPGAIQIDLAFDAGDAVLTVQDRGVGFEPHVNVLPKAWDESGRGLFLVETYAGSVPRVVRRPRGGSKVTVRIRGAGPGGSGEGTIPLAEEVALVSR